MQLCTVYKNKSLTALIAHEISCHISHADSCDKSLYVRSNYKFVGHTSTLSLNTLYLTIRLVLTESRCRRACNLTSHCSTVLDRQISVAKSLVGVAKSLVGVAKMVTELENTATLFFF